MASLTNVRTSVPSVGGDRAAGPGAVTEYMIQDHRRIEALLATLEARFEAGDLDDARAAFHPFEVAFLRHLRIEEQIVFPVFQARTGIPGPTAVLREEHREFRRAVGLMQEAVMLGNKAQFRDALAYLRSLDPDHNAKEERVLYPTTDRLLTPEESLALVARMRSE